jgi:ComF family protein
MSSHVAASKPALVRAARWPSRCAVCGQWGGARLCEACLERFASPRPRCARCAIALPSVLPLCADCMRQPPPYDQAVAAVDYDYPWADVVAAFKFAQGLDRAGALAALLAQAVASDGTPAVDLVVPVPLAPRRLAERGYNQAWELARRVARHLGVRADARLLRRLVDTPHVADLPRDARAAAVRGAFALDPRRAAAVRGQRIALVDDVMTTGATLGEAARVLRHAGAAEVHAWVLARTPAPHDD